jgi:hypothetical protein
MRSVVEDESCEAHHVGVNLSGRQGFLLRDGTTVTKIFGQWPSFHDAEALRVRFDNREGPVIGLSRVDACPHSEYTRVEAATRARWRWFGRALGLGWRAQWPVAVSVWQPRWAQGRRRI